MDTEDCYNDDDSSGWYGAIDIYDDGIEFIFCKVDGRYFKPINTGEMYAVIKLSNYVPPGSLIFSRYFDTDDGNDCSWGPPWESEIHINTNAYGGGSIEPNGCARNIRIYFCLFTKYLDSDTMDRFPSYDHYGVFAPSDFSKATGTEQNKEIGKIHTDDEDEDNNNSFEFYDKDKWKEALQKWCDEYNKNYNLNNTIDFYRAAKEFISPIIFCGNTPPAKKWKNTDMNLARVR